jgi:hypothetical protein
MLGIQRREDQRQRDRGSTSLRQMARERECYQAPFSTFFLFTTLLL